jgi:hypothetical protein
MYDMNQSGIEGSRMALVWMKAGLDEAAPVLMNASVFLARNFALG